MNNEKKAPVRQIKFRGLRVDGKGLVYGDLLTGVGYYKKGRFYILPTVENLASIEGCHPLDGLEVIPESVGQFTGLLDKNGKEIYEGDIMINPNHRCGKKRFSVEWTVGGYDARYFEQGNYTLCLYPVLGEFEGCEVIGNIHEESEVNNG
ncbi:YopX family protein [Sphingobacterium sp.]|uniref:YopX family protein n=1 Tax=Sphingobacterium sp. TaxID=341027 RepID=UPI00289D0D9A|nr:YopX family protein [Sphingobacterium sp.]